ncbi:hypothetical protein GCM10023156_08590 [Novipirellula rosea]|uniref:Uncharacterized protein n=1 Tax=Novipirellula rosea TaxID=1031540 RepID=A0ABP8MCW1_9BACT
MQEVPQSAPARSKWLATKLASHDTDALSAQLALHAMVGTSEDRDDMADQIAASVRSEHQD